MAGSRLHGERGTAIITVTVLLFSITFLAIVALSRDVNRVVSNRSAAQSIAFQAARAGAQQVETGALRGSGGGEPIVLNGFAAEAEARRIADRLFESYGLVGEIRIRPVVGDTVEVTAIVDDPNGAVSATASVQAQTGP